MTPERFREVEALFHAASDRPSSERNAFLAAHCAGDESLRREVATLLDRQDAPLLTGGAVRLLPEAAPQRREGTRIGDYVLGALIGSGGMGHVYRTRDTRLNRDVALKVLSGELGLLPERLARFEREARILAAINHPHIASIHDIVRTDDLVGLVLELVDGVTLRERIHPAAEGNGRGHPLEISTALELARQIADALHAAHRKGIVHRDLKPDNVKITPDGTIKVLDFGLAKMEAPEGDRLPVLTTREGVLLGTVAYMSPEQARGLEVDRRTDIWAFGCVLYEMLAGARAFPGDSAADVLARITTSEPDWTLLPAALPPRVRVLLKRCLAIDADRRLHDIADVRLEIEDALADEERVSEARRRTTRPRGWLLAGAIAALSIAGAAVATLPLRSDTPRRAIHAAVPLPPDLSVWAIGRGSSVVISPDGQRLVFAGVTGGRRQLFVRTLADGSTWPIPGTEDATSPFLSPDGQWIGFIDDPNGGSIKRVPIKGGTAVSVVNRSGDPEFAVRGASWGAGDTIVFSSIAPQTKGLWRVPASGGRPTRITTLRPGEMAHAWPQLLPGGDAVLFTIWRDQSFDGSRLAVQRLDSGEPRVIIEGGSHGRLVARPDGDAWLLYARMEGLMAVRIDGDTLQPIGGAFPAAGDVLVNLSGGAHFSVSDHGMLAYVPGGLDEGDKTPVWVTRSGAAEDVRLVPGLGFQYRLSPDGTRLVRPNAVGPSRDLYVDYLQPGTASHRLSFGDLVNSPIWTHDGERIIYAAGPANANLFWRPADGSGAEARLTTSPNKQMPNAVSPDGRLLVYTETGRENSGDLWLLPLDGGEPRLLAGTPAAEGAARFSPDGRWVVYHARRSGEAEVYVTSVREPRRPIRVSNGEGWNPLWSPDGREIYYRDAPPASAEGQMVAVPVDTSGGPPVLGEPRVLFPATYQGEGDIAADGRFLLLHRTRPEASSRFISLVLDWFSELDTRAPAR